MKPTGDWSVILASNSKSTGPKCIKGGRVLASQSSRHFGKAHYFMERQYEKAKQRQMEAKLKVHWDHVDRGSLPMSRLTTWTEIASPTAILDFRQRKDNNHTKNNSKAYFWIYLRFSCEKAEHFMSICREFFLKYFMITIKMLQTNNHPFYSLEAKEFLSLACMPGT